MFRQGDVVRVRFSDRWRIVQVIDASPVEVQVGRSPRAEQDWCPSWLGRWVHTVVSDPEVRTATSDPEVIYTVSYEIQVLSCQTSDGSIPVLGDSVVYLQRTTGAEIPGTVVKVLSCNDGYVLRVQRGGIDETRMEPLSDDTQSDAQRVV